MALVFKVGEHEEFPPVPKNFPRCNSFMPLAPPEVVDGTEVNSTNSILSTTPNPKENEIHNVEDVKNSIKLWLPIILKELGIKSSASSFIYQKHVLGFSFIFVIIHYLRMLH